MNSMPDALAATDAATINASMVSSAYFLRRGRRLVRADDLLHERMADHVAVGELDEADALDLAEDLACLVHARRLPRRQVDLRRVAGHHGLRPEAQPGEEHLHLLAGGVLRLVEDHERVIK